jgi:hypothetical protein
LNRPWRFANTIRDPISFTAARGFFVAEPYGGCKKTGDQIAPTSFRLGANPIPFQTFIVMPTTSHKPDRERRGHLSLIVDTIS